MPISNDIVELYLEYRSSAMSDRVIYLWIIFVTKFGVFAVLFFSFFANQQQKARKGEEDELNQIAVLPLTN